MPDTEVRPGGETGAQSECVAGDRLDVNRIPPGADDLHFVHLTPDRGRRCGMSARTIEQDVTLAEVAGSRRLLVLPVIPDAAPYAVREGIARRRIAAATGTCPCGATTDYRDLPGPGEAGVAEVWHEPLCPAETRKLQKAIRRWAR